MNFEGNANEREIISKSNQITFNAFRQIFYELLPESIKFPNLFNEKAADLKKRDIIQSLDIDKLVQEACSKIMAVSTHQAGTNIVPPPPHVKEDASKPVAPPPIESEQKRNEKL